MSGQPYARGVNPRLAAVLQAKAARDWQASVRLLPANDRAPVPGTSMLIAGDGDLALALRQALAAFDRSGPKP